jgi:hypothetical protein
MNVIIAAHLKCRSPLQHRLLPSPPKDQGPQVIVIIINHHQSSSIIISHHQSSSPIIIIINHLH